MFRNGGPGQDSRRIAGRRFIVRPRHPSVADELSHWEKCFQKQQKAQSLGFASLLSQNALKPIF